jgi:hypothetical protein
MSCSKRRSNTACRTHRTIFRGRDAAVSKFDPSDGSGTSGLTSTLYGGVWAAEYALRLSSSGQVQRVGMHQLVSPAGIDLTNNHLREVNQAYSQGKTVDTTGLNFGYFQSAQAVAYAVASSALNSASLVYSTSVVGGSTVSLASGGTVPALYAKAFKTGDSIDLVVTNKGAATEVISITVNGQAVSSQLLVPILNSRAFGFDLEIPRPAGDSAS